MLACWEHGINLKDVFTTQDKITKQIALLFPNLS